MRAARPPPPVPARLPATNSSASHLAPRTSRCLDTVLQVVQRLCVHTPGGELRAVAGHKRLRGAAARRRISVPRVRWADVGGGGVSGRAAPRRRGTTRCVGLNLSAFLSLSFLCSPPLSSLPPCNLPSLPPSSTSPFLCSAFFRHGLSSSPSPSSVSEAYPLASCLVSRECSTPAVGLRLLLVYVCKLCFWFVAS